MDVVAVARRAIGGGPLCDACLGRCVADRSHGLSNGERGRALRVALAMRADEPIDTFRPDEACWVCEGLCDRFDVLAQRIVDAVTDVDFATYQVGTRVPAFVEENDRLLREDARGDPAAGEALKRECNREIGKRVGRLTGAEVDFERPDIVALVDVEADVVEMTVNSAFVYGRYRKLERGIPQTRWPCSDCEGTGRVEGDPCPVCEGSGMRYLRSVEQLVAPPIVAAMEGSGASFHGAGREDVDARMLGRGRPFVVEVDEPHRRTVDLEAVRSAIEADAVGAVEVEDLHLVTHEMVEHVKELDASKVYAADIRIDGDVTEAALADAVERLSGATIEQRTPRRVDHRRADRHRTRTVHEASVLAFDGETARIEVHGAGGLYIKELLHGDSGRTDPNLADLLGRVVDVEALDVVDVRAPEGATFLPDAYRR